LEDHTLILLVQSFRRINVANCDELEAAIDPDCSFEQEQIDKFTADMLQNGGDFTMAFWVKPTGALSMNEHPKAPKDSNGQNRFFPHITFYAQTSPPQHNLQWGLWVSLFLPLSLFSLPRTLSLSV
jgi:hypothetical protein